MEADYQKHKKFLFEKAIEVDNLIADEASYQRFRDHIKSFCEAVAAYASELESHNKAAQSDPKLLNFNDGRPPKNGYVWHNNFWAPQTNHPNLLNYFPPNSYLLWPDSDSKWLKTTSRNARLPTDDERIMCYYVLLAVTHDGALTQPTFKRLYFGQSCQNTWTFRDEWGWALWSWLSDLSLWNSDNRDLIGEKIKATVAAAFNSVKADLAKLKPAETEQNARRIIAAILISLLIICMFALSVWLIPFTPFTWLKNHPNSYGLQGSIIFLIPSLIVGLFKPQWRNWCWGTAGIALLVLILSLLGGRSPR